jgi:hypothetical protein
VDVIADALGIPRHFVTRVLFQFQFEANVVVGISGSDMPMKVKYGLTGNFSIVAENIEPFQLKP